jgi:hypothetical protein
MHRLFVREPLKMQRNFDWRGILENNRSQAECCSRCCHIVHSVSGWAKMPRTLPAASSINHYYFQWLTR